MEDALDTPETIRQQMDETRSQLNEKLESLELQVAETFQSTGSAVNATVEAVQESVESVSGAVQDAVHSVSNAFNIGLQIERHPLLVLGGAAVLGYLASEYFTRANEKSEPLQESVPAFPFVSNRESQSAQERVSPPAPTVAAAYESGRESSSWNQFRDVAFGVLIGVVQDIASRSVPRIVDYLTGESGGVELHDPAKMDEQAEFTDGTKSFDTSHHFRIASSGIARTGNSF